jgi:hypothetical protein
MARLSPDFGASGPTRDPKHLHPGYKRSSPRGKKAAQQGGCFVRGERRFRAAREHRVTAIRIIFRDLRLTLNIHRSDANMAALSIQRRDKWLTINDREMLDVGPPTPPDTVEGKREDVRRVIVQNLTYAVIGIPVISVITVAVMPDRLTALKEILPLI